MTQKEKIKHERVLKLKKIGFWTLNIVSYILAGLFLIVLIISLSTPKKQNVSPRSAYKLYENEITEVINDIPNNVVYDDENKTITLSADELNNYTWNNLNDYLYTQIITNERDLTDFLTFSYNDINSTFNSADNDSELLYFKVSISNIYQIEFNNDDFGDLYNKFAIFDIDFDDYIDFEYDLLFNISTSLDYTNIKNAIELDISANETSETQTIFESLTNVLSNFITTLNSGITSVLNLFWNSTTSQLTLLGNLTTIVIGVAVCFFLFRLVIGLIRLRG